MDGRVTGEVTDIMEKSNKNKDQKNRKKMMTIEQFKSKTHNTTKSKPKKAGKYGKKASMR